jgi:hypothetical protein
MRGEIIQKLNLEDRKVFRRWLCIYAVYGAMFLTGLIALALNVLGDKSEATDQHATIHHKLLPAEPSSISPAVRATQERQGISRLHLRV